MNHEEQLALPINCPICKKLVWYGSEPASGKRTIFQAENENLTTHDCLKNQGEDYWNKKIFALLADIRPDNLRLAGKIKWKPSKLALKRHPFAVVSKQEATTEEGAKNSLHAFGLDGRGLKLLMKEKCILPPYSLIQLKNPKKTSDGSFRVTQIEKKPIPFSLAKSNELSEEICGLVFKARDAEQLEVFLERVLARLKKSAAKIINYLPLKNETSEAGILYCAQINIVSEQGMSAFFKQFDVPEYIHFQILQLRQL